MQTIHKFLITDTPIDMPAGAKILSVQMQGHTIRAWALVDTERPPEPRRFRIFGTGMEIPEGLEYLATLQDEFFVWHVFEVPPP